jgi:hypothetical protein
MDVTAVASTTLATIAYDDTRTLLQLEFRSRAIYQYFGVPAAVHEALLGAPSKGSYFNHAIRGRYPVIRVAGLQAERPRAAVPPQCGHEGGAPWHVR